MLLTAQYFGAIAWDSTPRPASLRKPQPISKKILNKVILACIERERVSDLSLRLPLFDSAGSLKRSAMACEIFALGCVSADIIPVPIVGIFRDPFPGREVDADNSESRPVAGGPLKVVHQGPEEVTTDIDTLFPSRLHRLEVTVKEFDAFFVMNFSVSGQGISEERAVLRDVDWRTVVALMHFEEHLAEFGWVNFPPVIGSRDPGRRIDLIITDEGAGIRDDVNTKVVVHPQKIDRLTRRLEVALLNVRRKLWKNALRIFTGKQRA